MLPKTANVHNVASLAPTTFDEVIYDEQTYAHFRWSSFMLFIVVYAFSSFLHVVTTDKEDMVISIINAK